MVLRFLSGVCARGFEKVKGTEPEAEELFVLKIDVGKGVKDELSDFAVSLRERWRSIHRLWGRARSPKTTCDVVCVQRRVGAEISSAVRRQGLR